MSRCSDCVHRPARAVQSRAGRESSEELHLHADTKLRVLRAVHADHPGGLIKVDFITVDTCRDLRGAR